MGVMVLIGAVVGALFLGAAFFVHSAQQQVALAGMACASTLIPYVLFRMHSIAIAQRQRERIIELLQHGGPAGGAQQGGDVGGGMGSPMGGAVSSGMVGATGGPGDLIARKTWSL